MNTESAAAALIGENPLGKETLNLKIGECSLRMRSNSTELVTLLRGYFAHTLGDDTEPDIEMIAIEREPPELDVPFVDWAREPGKKGRKDAYCELDDGRLILKVRTGMVFLQSETARIAAGPCLRYDNQVINYINAQYMNWLQQRGWLICHASGLVYQGRCLGMAGFSGGGKSTLMLHLMERAGVSYLTNDRLFIRRDEDSVEAVGIPKLPRINPGTIVHNPRLHPLIEADERERLLALPQQELWDIEDKYDVQVGDLYGPGKITPQAPMSAFLVLNWKRGSSEPLQLNRVDLDQRRDLLGAIMKSPGPFYQYADGHFHQDTTPFDAPAYLAAMQGVDVYEAAGGVDFDGLIALCLNDVMG